ncbi:DUF4190 domain-containing protein [Actinomadura barringtoniae]|uniref:DUF4190 domain-containing protein n=1 Tax=Actinomadura barringtoniae TaxID=1427535 RepID=A0A939T8V0_9ACTN|nr:DUF4190 domain-containing protein [Actinomadura barringtoniae]MBO2453564.1 DUF4190 domain-containing protein [Actinomadura barringtoniae]
MAQPPYGPSDPYGYGPDAYGGGYGPPQPSVQHHYYGAPPPMMPPTNGMATAALICGIAGIVVCGLASPLAIIFGHISRGQIRRTGEQGDGMALAGLILGYIVTVLWLLVVLFYFGLIAALISSDHASGA